MQGLGVVLLTVASGGLEGAVVRAARSEGRDGLRVREAQCVDRRLGEGNGEALSPVASGAGNVADRRRDRQGRIAVEKRTGVRKKRGEEKEKGREEHD